MANQIRMTPDTMRTRAGEYTAQAEAIQNVIGKLDTLLKNLQSEWEGDASRAYAAKFNELRPGFVKAKNLVDGEKSAQMPDASEILML